MFYFMRDMYILCKLLRLQIFYAKTLTVAAQMCAMIIVITLHIQ